ncbi:MAG: 5-(carboxyamino)imidazole ribonucleotide synthase [Alphaproteobacteria bacterium]|nr:5-(carboxyamino)imidazole ribonucleotide synthase [Alphaproteobacteria bacterium]
MGAILPGGTLGLLGGGQLARMTALPARQLGYRVVALDPNPDCPVAGVCDALIVAPFDSVEGATRLAEQADVLTFDIERIGAEAAAAAEALKPVRPGPRVLELIQDRETQKAWLDAQGFPLGPWRAAHGADALAEAGAAFGWRARAKVSRGGYDGRGQARLFSAEEAAQAALDFRGQPAVVEQELALVAELSVMVARRPSGQVRAFPPSFNVHRDSILDVAVLPAPLPAPLLRRAEALAHEIADAIGLEGLLAVEMFLVGEDTLLVNELAPRPHNSYHHSQAACATSQFEQLVRAVCDLPLGEVEVLRPTAMANLLGDLWLGPRPPPLEEALGTPGLQLHLYGKEPRPKRKVGHLNASAPTPEAAMALAREARRRLFEGAGVPERL